MKLEMLPISKSKNVGHKQYHKIKAAKSKRKNESSRKASKEEVTYGYLDEESEDEEFDEYGRRVGLMINDSAYGGGKGFYCFGCNLRSCRRENPSRFIAAQYELKSLRKKRQQLDQMELDFEQERRNGCILLILCATMMCVCAVLFVDQIFPAENNPNFSPDVSNNLDNDVPIENLGDTENKIDTFIEESKSSTKRKKEAEYLRTKQKSFDHDVHFKTAGDSDEKDGTDGTASSKKEEPKQISLVHDEDFENDLKKMETVEERVDKLSLYEPWNIPYKPSRGVPVYFHIRNSGSTTVDEILSHCVHLVQATDDIFITSEHDQENGLKVFSHHDGAQYVNVNMASIEGIARAKELKLVNEDIADIFRTSLIYEAASLFESSSKRGKCFTLLRHPLERAVAVYNMLHKSTPKFKNMTLEEYANSQYCEENWVVRHLSQEMDHPLDVHHLQLAKQVLGRKCIVGFSDQFQESMRRFEKYFGWDLKYDPAARLSCEANILKITKDSGLEKAHDIDDKIHSLFKAKNAYDLELYAFAQDLFQKQALYGES